jgi:hypothetical protein
MQSMRYGAFGFLVEHAGSSQPACICMVTTPLKLSKEPTDIISVCRPGIRAVVAVAAAPAIWQAAVLVTAGSMPRSQEQSPNPAFLAVVLFVVLAAGPQWACRP